jgi:hypothetical protein
MTGIEAGWGACAISIRGQLLLQHLEGRGTGSGSHRRGRWLRSAVVSIGCGKARGTLMAGIEGRECAGLAHEARGEDR